MMTEEAKNIWKKVQEEGFWNQEPGQRTELEVRKIGSGHQWEGEDAFEGTGLFPREIREGDIVGLDDDGHFIILKNEEELEEFLKGTDEEEDETTQFEEDQEGK